MKKGIAASKGYAIGKVFIQEHEEIVITDAKVSDVAAEKEKLTLALQASKEQLTAIKEKTLAEIGEHEAAVFEAHLTLLDDPEFTGTMEATVEGESLNAMKAVQNVTDTFVMIFESMDDAYMRERAADIKDVSKRIISNLAGKGGSAFAITEENTVVIAYDLTPSDTAQLDRTKVCGFLTDIGGRTSHSAIMARTLEIPAVVGLGDITKSVKNGDSIIVDGIEGFAIINPTEEVIAELEDSIRREEEALYEIQLAIQQAQQQAASGGGGYVPNVSGSSKPAYGSWVWPSDTYYLTDTFGYQAWRGGLHNGIDIGAPHGSPIYAAASGTVWIAGWSSSAGNWVVIDHGGGVLSVYMHASALYVSSGQYVNAGSCIAAVGNTGYSFGAHLHFGIMVGSSGGYNGYWVDPLGYVSP